MIRFFFKQNPFVRVLFLCFIGFIIGNHFSSTLYLFFFLFMGSLLAFVGLEIWIKGIQQIILRPLKAILLYVNVVSISAIFWIYAQPDANSIHYVHFTRFKYGIGYIEKVNRHTPKYTSYIVRLTAGVADSIQTPIEGKLLVYVQHQDTSKSFNTYGETFIFPFKIEEVPEPENELDFDYKSYLIQQGIFHRVYVQDRDWVKTHIYNGNILFRKAQACQAYFVALFKSTFNAEVFGFLSGLALGNADYIDEETVKDFRKTGTTHILSVSGLHVGIVFLALSFCFNKIKRLKLPEVLVPIFIISGLWYYAFLTGLMPSVMRSALMFSAIAWSNYVKRYTSTYNIICASALVILCINPLEIFNLGFQLSYLAVIGIIYFQPKIAAFFSFSYRALQWIWELMAVSMAAQLTTLPIILYYFHQFPSYFLLSNLLLVPLSSFCLYQALIFMVSFYIPYWETGVQFILIYSTKLVLFLNQFLAQLPYATIDFIGHNALFNFLFMFFCISMVTSIYFKNFKQFKIGLSILLLLLILVEFNRSITYNKSYIASIYKNNKRAYVFISNHKALILNLNHIPKFQLQFNIDPILSRYAIIDTAWDNGNDSFVVENFERKGAHIFFNNLLLTHKQNKLYDFKTNSLVFDDDSRGSVRLIED